MEIRLHMNAQVDLLRYDHNVVLLDIKNEKGVTLKALKDKDVVILKVVTTSN